MWIGVESWKEAHGTRGGATWAKGGWGCKSADMADTGNFFLAHPTGGGHGGHHGHGGHGGTTGEDGRAHASACIRSVGNYDCTRLTRLQGHEAGARGPLPAMPMMATMAMMATPWAEPRKKNSPHVNGGGNHQNPLTTRITRISPSALTPHP